jgi:hypothetical protein
MKLSATLRDAQTGHSAWVALWAQIKPHLFAGRRYVVEVRPEKRSDEQNRRMWALLSDLSKQVDWHGCKLTAEEWKDVVSAALKRQKVVPGIDGGFVVLGLRTSQMSVAEMAELQTLIEAFGAHQGVRFSAPEYMASA